MGAISTFDIFKIGVGPSSSHTLGPWRAAERFLASCRECGIFGRVARVRVELFGSLAKTGKGHGTDVAVLMGLSGEDPVTCDTAQLHAKAEAIRSAGTIRLASERAVAFDPAADLVFHRHTTLPFHPNGLTFTAILDDGSEHRETYYSVGGGFVVREGEPPDQNLAADPPLPFATAADLLRRSRDEGLTIPQVVRRNELAWRSPRQIGDGLQHLWGVMKECAFRGSHAEGVLPGGLGVVRRAAGINRRLLGGRVCATADEWLEAIRAGGGFQETLNWVSCFALAVNEENAAFGRVVTAPTNGAAGVVPAVLLYYHGFCDPGAAGVEDFLLTAAAVGALFKTGATISAAQGGCQAEIGVSSAMAAAGLAQCLGGTPAQVLMAAEVAMEHHLGLTCDPVGGLVQVPCIERNTMGAVKAITACHLALASDPARAKVSLDAVIRSMWQTALDMDTKYKETAEGGLALQISVNVSEC